MYQHVETPEDKLESDDEYNELFIVNIIFANNFFLNTHKINSSERITEDFEYVNE